MDSETLPKVETMPENPVSPYALSKLAGEKYSVIFHRIYGLPTVCLRYLSCPTSAETRHLSKAPEVTVLALGAVSGFRPVRRGGIVAFRMSMPFKS
jgi:UDP-glucose 4-epimerase